MALKIRKIPIQMNNKQIRSYAVDFDQPAP